MSLLTKCWQLAVVAVLGVILLGCKPAYEYVAKDITESHFKKEYAFNDLNGHKKTPASFQGKVTALYFGYTFCPDFCPNTLFKLQQVTKILGNKKDLFQVVFVTVDPERDSVARLREYATNFPDLKIISLRPTDFQLRDIKAKFRIDVTKVPGQIIPEDYTVDHITSIILYDKNGRVRRGALYEETAEELAQDILNLYEQY